MQNVNKKDANNASEKDADSWMKPIHIMFKTNIPGDIGYKVLTLDMLYYPDLVKSNSSTSGMYPFMTDEIEFPIDVISQMSYPDVLSFFFDKNNFANLLNPRNSIIMGGAVYDEESYRKTLNENFKPNVQDTGKGVEKAKLSNEILNNNTLIMIQSLFRTGMPLQDNKTSYNAYIRNVPDKVFIPPREKRSSFYSLLFPLPENGSKQGNFTYLKLSNKIYTINETIQLNDTLNHPLYKELFVAYDDTEKVGVKIDQRIRDNTRMLLSQISELRTIIDNMKNDPSTESLLKQILAMSNFQSITGTGTELLDTIKKNEKFNDVYNALYNLLTMKALPKSLNVSRTTVNKLNDVFEILKETETLKIIRNSYFIKAVDEQAYTLVNMSDKDYKANVVTLSKKYTKDNILNYKMFYEKLDSFGRRASTPFQEKVDNYLKDKEFIALNICGQSNCSFPRGDTVPENVGVSRYIGKEKQNYEIYIFISVFGVEINDSNVSKVTCEYKNVQLGKDFNEKGKYDKTYTRVVNSKWEVNTTNPPYIDIASEILEKASSKIIPVPVPAASVIKGGYHSLRRRKAKRNNRRKNRTQKKHVRWMCNS